MCGACASRRSFLALSAAAALAACSENAETGRRQLAFVPDDQLSALADQTWAEVVRQHPPLNDPAADARLARIGRRLAEASGRTDLNWRFAVLDGADVNAFVLPNGQVGVFRGLFEFARSDDEIASVLGHEIGHVLARHPAERVSQELAVQAGVSLAQVLLSSGENAEQAGQIAGALGIGATVGVLLPYSRRHELEADKIGVELMRDAGFAPGAAVSFWERMIARSEGPRPLEALSTHPADERRLTELKAAVAAA
jgi:predicted Zn-dependent protease